MYALADVQPLDAGRAEPCRAARRRRARAGRRRRNREARARDPWRFLGLRRSLRSGRHEPSSSHSADEHNRRNRWRLQRPRDLASARGHRADDHPSATHPPASAAGRNTLRADANGARCEFRRRQSAAGPDLRGHQRGTGEAARARRCEARGARESCCADAARDNNSGRCEAGRAEPHRAHANGEGCPVRSASRRETCGRRADAGETRVAGSHRGRDSAARRKTGSADCGTRACGREARRTAASRHQACGSRAGETCSDGRCEAASACACSGGSQTRGSDRRDTSACDHRRHAARGETARRETARAGRSTRDTATRSQTRGDRRRATGGNTCANAREASLTAREHRDICANTADGSRSGAGCENRRRGTGDARSDDPSRRAGEGNTSRVTSAGSREGPNAARTGRLHDLLRCGRV